MLSVGSSSNQYNGDGTLVAQTQNSITTRYTHDLAAPLSQILSDGTQHSVYGMPAERLFAQHNTTKTWYRVDALNSVRALLDDAGIPQNVANYDAWGVPETSAIAPFGFTGELQHGSDVWLRARWYGAGRGGFGARDPFAGWGETPYSLQYYQYGYSNPVSNQDPSGRCLPQRGQYYQQCLQWVKTIKLHGFQLAHEESWYWFSVQRVRDSIELFRDRAHWSTASFWAAMTGFGNFAPIIYEDMPDVYTGTTPDAQGTTIAVHINLKGDGNLARYSLMHEFVHVWDHTTLHTLSNGLVQATGGFNERVPIGNGYDKLLYHPCSPLPIPKGYYGAASQYEDLAEAVMAVLMPEWVKYIPRQVIPGTTRLFIDDEAQAGGMRRTYVERILTEWFYQ